MLFAWLLMSSSVAAQGDPPCNPPGLSLCVATEDVCTARGDVPIRTSDCGAGFCCTNSARRPIDAQKPIVVFYGMLQADAGGPDEALNMSLASGLERAEVVFATHNPGLLEYPGWTPEADAAYDVAAPHTEAFTRWRARVKLAKRLSDVTLRTWIDDPSLSAEEIAHRIARFFDYGWDYVYVDELSKAEWGTNERTAGPDRVRKLEAVLRTLRDLRLDRRFILYIHAYTVGIHRPARQLGELREARLLFSVAERYARAVFLETYPTNANNCGSRCLTTRRVLGHRSASLLQDLAERYERVAGRSSMRISGAALGISNEPDCSGRSCRYLDRPTCDLAPRFGGPCPNARANARGGLHAQFTELNRPRSAARRMRAISLYSLADVEPTPRWTRAQFATALNGWLRHWVANHR